MKVAFILSTCENLGPFIVARDIINNIHDEVDGIDIYYLKESNKKLEFKAKTIKVSLFQPTDLSHYGIVHSHGLLGDFYAYRNRRSIKGCWVTTMHQDIRPDYAMRYNALVGFLLEKFWCHIVDKSTCVVTLTQQMVNYYRLKIDKAELTHIHNGTSPKPGNGLDVQESARLTQLRSSSTMLGISANLTYRKGIDRAIEALATPNGKGLSLIIIGDGERKEDLVRLSMNLNVQDRCLFLGYKKNAIDYFKYFDLYLMCSRSEGFGLCVIEAASQEVPVVCNDLPVYRELFTDDEVVRFRLHDLGSMVAAVQFAAKNRVSLSASIFRKYTTHFSSQIMAKKYLSLYLRLGARESQHKS